MKALKQSIQKKELMSRIETSELLGVSLVTVHKWVNQGLLSCYKLGGKVYFKRSEVMDAIESRQVSKLETI